MNSSFKQWKLSESYNQLQASKRQLAGLRLLQMPMKNVNFELEISMKNVFFIKLFSDLHCDANTFWIIQRMWKVFIVVSRAVNDTSGSAHVIHHSLKLLVIVKFRYKISMKNVFFIKFFYKVFSIFVTWLNTLLVYIAHI